MQATSPLSRIAGSLFGRVAANRGFHRFARRRVLGLAKSEPVAVQERTLLALVRKAQKTRFGIDHGFERIRTLADYQRAVPLRNYEDLWKSYLQEHYPVFDNVTWPGRIPYLALTSGTTLGETKYIPVSREMLESNKKASLTMLAFQLANHPQSRLFRGRLFFLGGSSDLERVGSGVQQGDLSGIAAKEVSELLRPYTFPPLSLALEADWDRKLSQLAERSLDERITLVGGVPNWLLALFQKLLEQSGRSTIAQVWPHLEVVVHGGVKFDPYRDTFTAMLGDPKIRLQETYPCSEGFIGFGDPATGFLRLIYDHDIFYEFVPLEELAMSHPTRHWLGNVERGVNYAIVVSTCAGLWSHIIGDTVRFELRDPPLMTFTGRTKYTLSAFGEHLISEEIESAVAKAAELTGGSVLDWHVGPVFRGSQGHHLYVFEFMKVPADLHRFRWALDADLAKRNADYRAHRGDVSGLPLPALVVARSGAFEEWMRSRGRLGGQNKVPRIDNTGETTRQLEAFIRASNLVAEEIGPGLGG